MVHARMIRPAVAGAVPVKVDEARSRTSPARKVVWEKDFLAVVADKEWDAIKAAEKLKVEWSEAKPPFPDQATLYDHIRKATVRKRSGREAERRRRRSVRESRQDDRGRIRMAVPVACQHGTGLRAWSRSRTARSPAGAARRSRTSCSDGARRILGVPVENVHVIWMPGPGSYGRNDADDAAMDAAVIAKAVGKPGARAIHARPGHRLGSEGPRLGPHRPRRAGCLGQGHRL